MRRENLYGYLFLAPWLIGFFFLFFGPGLASIYFSFTEYSVITPARPIGLDNYTRMFTQDRQFWPSLQRTIYYAGVSVPLGLIGSLAVAMLLDQKVKGLGVYRTMFFAPSLVPIVASAVLWVWLLNPDFGILNQFLIRIGISDPPAWFGSRRWAIPALILMALWQSVGGTRMIIFLAGLQGIPESLYDASFVDGANAWQRMRHVTLPLLTPTIFFNLVLGIIGALQVFTAAFVATGGGPGHATLFFGLHIYRQGFDYWNMGYACALAWVFALVIVSLTLLNIRLGERWVFYYGGA